MPPQRSQRVASRPGLTGKPAKLARGQRGYHKHRTGFLNVKPIGSEIDVGLKNTRDSPLLRLPPEVRNRIWSFALGESPIKMKSTFLKSERNDSEYARWNLLRVCRQVYVETAMMAYTLATFHFAYIEDIRPYLRSKTLKHVQKIHLGTFSTDVVDVGNRVWARFFRSKNFPSLRKIKVTMWESYSDTELEAHCLMRAQRLVNSHFPGKEVEVCQKPRLEYKKCWEES